MEPVKLVVVSAGLGQPSSTRMLADRLAEAATRHVENAAQARPVEADIIELRGLASDIANNMVTGFPGSALREALQSVSEADGLIAVTPVFTASYSGLFKSFFDVLETDALNGKPVLMAATGGTARHSLTLEHAMRPLFAYLRAVTVPTAVFAASGDWGGGDAGTDDLASRIGRAAGELGELLLGRPNRRTAAEELVPFEEQLAALRSG